MNRLSPQNKRVLTLLQERGEEGATALDILRDAGVYRASGRILELRAAGFHIETQNRPGLTARYRLVRVRL